MRPFDEDLSQRVSVDRGKMESVSRGATNSSVKEEFKPRMDEIQKMKE